MIPPPSPEIIERCPICGSEESRRLFAYRGKYPIHRCSSCGLHYCARRFSDLELQRFYSEAYFKGDFGYRDYRAIETIKFETFCSRLAALESERPQKGRLLDVGCADGLLVKAALARGWDAFGIDISNFAIEEARKTLGDRVHTGTIEDNPFARESFDAILLSDTIEHVHDPASVLTHAHALLGVHGHLFVETPNVSGMMRRVLGRRWPMYRVPEHLVYLSPRNLEDLSSRIGFETVLRRSSWKALTWNYVMDKLAVDHGRLIGLVKSLGAWFGNRHFWIPAGSFWSIAVKIRPESSADSPGNDQGG